MIKRANAPLRRARQAMPALVRRALMEKGLMEAYRERPPYQRNDYLGWIGQAKLEATKQKRLAQMLDELARGGVYMNMAWRGVARRRPPSAILSARSTPNA